MSATTPEQLRAAIIGANRNSGSAHLPRGDCAPPPTIPTDSRPKGFIGLGMGKPRALASEQRKSTECSALASEIV